MIRAEGINGAPRKTFFLIFIKSDLFHELVFIKIQKIRKNNEKNIGRKKSEFVADSTFSC